MRIETIHIDGRRPIIIENALDCTYVVESGQWKVICRENGERITHYINKDEVQVLTIIEKK